MPAFSQEFCFTGTCQGYHKIQLASTNKCFTSLNKNFCYFFFLFLNFVFVYLLGIFKIVENIQNN